MKKLVTIVILFVSAIQLYAQSTPPYIPTNGLVAWWPFSGNAVDSSGNGNNGTVNGATLTTDRFGMANKAYYFSSTSCATRIDANVNTSSIQTGLTISLWVLRFGNGCIGPRLFEFWPGADGPGIASGSWDNTTPFIGIGSMTSTNFICSYGFPAVTNNTWTHIVYTNNGIIGKFYQDGRLLSTVNSNGNPILSSNLAIGRMNHPSFDAFNGNIDDFGIWNRALTQCEISNLYNAQTGTSSTQTQTSCNSYTLNNQTYTQSGTYTQVRTNAAGCDSTITLNLTIRQQSTSTLTESACSSYVLNGQTYAQSGTYTQVRTNAAGCDSTITLNLTIRLPSTSILTESACSSYVLNGQTYAQSGTYTQNLTNAAGCDSTITLNLTINQATTNIITQSNCNSFTLNNQTYTQSGTYTQNLTNAAGCDSIITLNLTINNSPTAIGSSTGATFHGATDGTVNLNVSGGATPYSFNWSNGANTEDLNTVGAGTYIVTITDANNCSSTTSVTVNQPPLALIKSPESIISSALYPNPATAQSRLELQLNQAQDFEIAVYNNLGQRLFNKNFSNTKELSENIDMRSWPAGQYFVEIKLPNGTETKKLIKE